MKLVCIEHYRCGEPDGRTYLFAPDGTDYDKLSADIGKAQAAYFAAKKAFAAAHPKPAWVAGNLRDFDENITIVEAKRLLAEGEKARDAWAALESATTRSFGDYMLALGYVHLWDAEPEVLTASADWGHRHGESLDYSKTTLDSTETWNQRKLEVRALVPVNVVKG